MKKKLYFNTLIALFYQVLAIISGLILPRLFIANYGSAVNGIVQSITQLLSVISLLDLGVGAVVQAALYKPLIDKDNKKVSEIYYSAKKYFTLIAKALLVYVIILSLYYGFLKNDVFSPLFSVTLIIAIAISYFAQYYFGLCDTLLLNADQRIYIVIIANMIGLILNTVVSIILINMNYSVQVVKLVSSILFLIRPLIMEIYVKRNYSLTKVKQLPKNAIPNKWSGLAQHIAVVVTNSVDNVMLTIFSTFSLVSVYNVYVMPLNSIRTLIDVTSTSYKSFFGSIIAKQDKIMLKNEFDRYETMMHFLVTLIFGTILKVLVPFVLVYTHGVTDTNYDNQLFGILITLAYAAYSLRLPYSNIIFAAGKFKETQIYSVIECIINIVVSLVLVNVLGLIGVAIGTVVSSGYRTIASAFYLQKDIMHRSILSFIKHLIADMICAILFMICTSVIYINMNGIFNWFIGSICYFLINLTVCFIVFKLMFGRNFKLIKFIKSRRK